jgi:transposase
VGTIVDVTDAEWDQVADLFDPDGRRGAPDLYPRRLMVEAMLWMARTGVQWRYLPEQFPPWTAVWSQWRRHGLPVRAPAGRAYLTAAASGDEVMAVGPRPLT